MEGTDLEHYLAGWSKLRYPKLVWGEKNRPTWVKDPLFKAPLQQFFFQTSYFCFISQKHRLVDSFLSLSLFSYLTVPRSRNRSILHLEHSLPGGWRQYNSSGTQTKWVYIFSNKTTAHTMGWFPFELSRSECNSPFLYVKVSLLSASVSAHGDHLGDVVAKYYLLIVHFFLKWNNLGRQAWELGV